MPGFVLFMLIDTFFPLVIPGVILSFHNGKIKEYTEGHVLGACAPRSFKMIRIYQPSRPSISLSPDH